MRSVLIKAAQAILSRGSRARFTAQERAELSLIVNAVERDLPTPLARAQRGEAAVSLFNGIESFEDEAASAVTDIMHAAHLRGLDPLKVLAQASERYAKEMGWTT